MCQGALTRVQLGTKDAIDRTIHLIECNQATPAETTGEVRWQQTQRRAFANAELPLFMGLSLGWRAERPIMLATTLSMSTDAGIIPALA